MVRSSTDGVLLFLSKAMHSKKGVIRLSFKRGGVFQRQHAKAHKRTDKQQLKEQLKQDILQRQKKEVDGHPTQQWPLITRVKTEEKHLNCQSKVGRAQELTESLLNFLRLAFYNEEKKQEKQVKDRSQPHPDSKKSLKRKDKKQRNKQRRTELKRRHKQTKIEQRKRAPPTKMQTEPPL